MVEELWSGLKLIKLVSKTNASDVELTSNGCPVVAATTFDFFESFGFLAGSDACGLSNAGIWAGCEEEAIG